MKKVLIVTYYWPPAGGPGVQRWLKFVKYLPEFDIEPVVFIPDNPYYPITDNSLEDEVPEGIEIIRHPIKEPYRIAKLLSGRNTRKMSSGMISENETSAVSKMMLYVRANYFIPDARIGWVKPSVQFLKTYLKAHNIEGVITSGPPHSLHLIGLELKKAYGISWIADFRDPWTGIHYHRSLPLTDRSARKHKDLESEVLSSADHVIVTSPGTRREFEALTQRPVTVITNGFEPLNNSEIAADKVFSISHIGSLLNERNPKLLWKLLSELKSEEESLSQDLKIRLIGRVSDEVVASVEAEGLSAQLELPGYVSHQEAVEFQLRSQLLLLIEIDRPETREIIPGKLFEYLRSCRPILAIGPRGSDVEDILEETDSGTYFSYGDRDALKEYLRNAYRSFKTGTIDSTTVNIEKFSRRNLTEKLAELLKSF